MDDRGRMLPTAFIPFCSYKSSTLFLGEVEKDLEFTPCNGFQSTILNGQLCYSIDLGNLTKAKSKTSKAEGLLMILDRGLTNEQDGSFTLSVNTLDNFVDSRDGSYMMTSIKKIEATEGFMALPNHDKGCREESYHTCRNRKFFEDLIEQCGCVPWNLKSGLKVIIDRSNRLT